jgi:hypothetical protein
VHDTRARATIALADSRIHSILQFQLIDAWTFKAWLGLHVAACRTKAAECDEELRLLLWFTCHLCTQLLTDGDEKIRPRTSRKTTNYKHEHLTGSRGRTQIMKNKLQLPPTSVCKPRCDMYVESISASAFICQQTGRKGEQTLPKYTRTHIHTNTHTHKITHKQVA